MLFGVCTLISFGIDLAMLVGLFYGFMQVLLEKITIFPSGIIFKIASFIDFSSIGCWRRLGDVRDYSDKAAYSNL